MRADPESYFPQDYRKARAAFIAAAEGRGIDVITRVHPSARGPDGKPLFLDTAALGPRDAASALLLICGTHGVEGYFGSAVQTGLLREGLAPPQGARVVLVHALNPYGFAWDRRVNEDNVDVNRNAVDYAAPPDNPGYDQLAGAIVPRDLKADTLDAANKVLLDYGTAHGIAALQAVVSSGQYKFPQGLWFGGRKECWSLAMLRAVLTEDLGRVRKLIAVDLHTGLGDWGTGEIITEAAPGDPAYARALALWGAAVKSSATGQSVSAKLTGTLDQALARWLPPVELTFVALEVGTTSLARVFDALRRDNWLHNFASASEKNAQAAEIARRCREVYYPDNAGWKHQAFDVARNAVLAAL